MDDSLENLLKIGKISGDAAMAKAKDKARFKGYTTRA
jgi:hypothetical protein